MRYPLATGGSFSFRWYHTLGMYWLGVMKSMHATKGLFAAFAVSAVGLSPAPAQLPSLNEAPWLGYFIGFANKRYQVGLSAVGKITLTPMGDRGTAVSHSLDIDIEMGILETFPDGKASLRQIKPESLESSDPATDNLKKAVIRGKVTGDATFEATLEQDRGIISIGGRIVDPGSLKNPANFAVRMRIPSAYAREKIEGKKEEKEFQKKIEGDRIELKWTDGKRIKQTFEKEVDASSKDLNGPGIAAAEVEIDAYQGRKILVTATENSTMTLWNSKPAPLHQGFSFNWQPDREKDKDGQSRLSLEVK